MATPIQSQRAKSFSPVLRRALRGFSVAALALAVSCASAKTQGSEPAGPDAEAEPVWLEASPALARDIEVKAIEVSMIRSEDDFVRLSDWFQTVREPAYPKLLDMAQSSDDKSRAFALAVISAMGDGRLLEPLKDAVPLSSVASQSDRYSMARALLKMGDNEGVPILIDGLESPSLRTRSQSYLALIQGTQANIKYAANASEEERTESVQRWRDWWSEMNSDPLLR